MDIVSPNLAEPRSGELLSDKKTDKLPRRTPDPNQLILIAEDNPANQKMVLYQLEKLGYTGHAVANGLEAIRALATIPQNSRGYDLVLMDCQMPEMDGFETTRRIRVNEAENGQHIPIVAMTANAMQGDREACLESGMDDYVAKPVTLNSLQQVLDRYMPCKTDKDDPLSDELQAEDRPGEGYEGILDQNALDSIRDLQSEIDSNLLNELIELFLSEGPKLIENIEKAISTNDSKAIQFAAHRLKGSSAYLGVIKVRSLCSEMEEQSREYELNNLSLLLPQLKTEYRRAALALRHEQQRIP
jgi:CheY-like chemotaxis protein/HPt (histidine-containing phosphotransfer) domain-containing protein